MSSSIDNQAFRNLLLSWPEKAMRFLYDRHYEYLLRIAEMYTRDRALAEDVLQEVFADIAAKHKELGTTRDQSIQTYLIRAIANHSITLYKRKLKSSIRETKYYYNSGERLSEPAVETKIIAAEKQSFLKLVLGTLPPRQKQCFLMQTEQNMSIKQIAGQLGISVKAVEWNLTCARKHLRKFAPDLN